MITSDRVFFCSVSLHFLADHVCFLNSTAQKVLAFVYSKEDISKVFFCPYFLVSKERRNLFHETVTFLLSLLPCTSLAVYLQMKVNIRKF